MLFARQMGFSVPANVPLAVQQGMLLLPQAIQPVSPGNKGRDMEGRHPSSLPSQDNPNLLGVPPTQGENTLEDPSHKWVINLSSKPLIQAQRSLLAKGPNYAIAPWHPPT